MNRKHQLVLPFWIVTVLVTGAAAIHAAPGKEKGKKLLAVDGNFSLATLASLEKGVA